MCKEWRRGSGYVLCSAYEKDNGDLVRAHGAEDELAFMADH